MLRSIRVGRPGSLLSPVAWRASLAHQPGRAHEQEPVSGLFTPGGLRGDPDRTLDPPERRTFGYTHTDLGPRDPWTPVVSGSMWDFVVSSHPPGWERHVGESWRPSRCLPHHPAALPLGWPRYQRLRAHGGPTQIPDGGSVQLVGGSVAAGQGQPLFLSLSRCMSSTWKPSTRISPPL